MIKKGRRKRKLHDSFYGFFLINSESLSIFYFLSRIYDYSLRYISNVSDRRKKQGRKYFLICISSWEKVF